MRFDRRTALKGLGSLAASPLLHACGEGGGERPLNESIDTVVVLMMENRSFDHYFGSLSLLEGRSDVDGLTAAMSNPTATGELVTPYRESLGCYADPPHGWNAAHRQFSEGTNQGFVEEHQDGVGPHEARRVMGYFTREDLPVSYALADEYALCQRWHASIMGPTWPNRFYLIAGQNNGVKGNDFEADYSFNTIFDRLLSAGLDFGAYYGNISLTWMVNRDYTGHYRELSTFYEAAAEGKLPAFSLVEPIYGRNDDHPPTHPLAGQLMIASVYDALAKSPQWGRSLLVVVYDEHGGFYDHVPPPKTADDFAADGFDQLGFRVPAVVMGPYVKKGVSSVLFDHTSVLAFVERLYGVAPLTARDRAANDLAVLLDRTRLAEQAPAAPIQLPQVVADEAVIYAPSCAFSVGSTGSGLVSTGQAELEALLERRPRPGLDRRAHTDRLFDRWVTEQKRSGRLRWGG